MKLLTAKALRPALSGAFILAATMSLAQSAATKPKLTLDVFFNSVSFPAIGTSPDGNSVIIQVERADWDQQIVRDDLWLYRRDAQHPEARSAGDPFRAEDNDRTRVHDERARYDHGAGQD